MLERLPFVHARLAGIILLATLLLVGRSALAVHLQAHATEPPGEVCTLCDQAHAGKDALPTDAGSASPPARRAPGLARFAPHAALRPALLAYRSRAPPRPHSA